MCRWQATMLFSLIFLLLREATTSLYPTENSIQNNTFVCGATRVFSGTYGSIKSPGYPIRYPANTYCTYDIKVEWHFRIELTWKDFDIDGDMPYCNSANGDYVEVFTGCGTNRRFLVRFCSRNSVTPHQLYSVDNCMSLRLFTSPVGLAKISKGFLAEYKAVNRAGILTTQDCNRTLTESIGIIHSTYWPHTYMSMPADSCNWHLKIDPTMALQFTFMDLDTSGYYGQCNPSYGSLDAVVVQGIGSLYLSTQSWKRFSGTCPPFVYGTLYNEMVVNWRINFKSNISYYRGFIVGYVSYRPIDRNMAVWQYAILITVAVLLMCSTLLFSFRHLWKRRSLKRHRYQRFVDIDSVSDDLPITRNQENHEDLEQHAEVSPEMNSSIERSEPPLDNEAGGSQYHSCGDLSSFADPEDFGNVRLRNFANIGHQSNSNDLLPLSNIRVEAIYHPLPQPANQQSTLQNQTRGNDDEEISIYCDDPMPNQQQDIGDTLANSTPPTSLLAASVPENTPANRPQASSLPPTFISPISFSSTCALPGTLNEPNENGITAGGAPGLGGYPVQEPGNKQGNDCVDDERPGHDSVGNNADRTTAPESSQAPENFPPMVVSPVAVSPMAAPTMAAPTMAPLHYVDIYDELRSLSRIVEDIISCVE